MEETLKEFFEKWLEEHKAPAEHPFRALFARIVDKVHAVEGDAAKAVEIGGTAIKDLQDEVTKLRMGIGALEVRLETAEQKLQDHIALFSGYAQGLDVRLKKAEESIKDLSVR